MKKNHRIVSLLLAALMAIGLMTTAFAAEPTINTGKRASLNIYKYDITTASADGAWDAESYVSTGLHDDAVIDKLAKYAVQGVEFTYLRVADIAMNNELVNGRRRVGVLYGFDGADEWQAGRCAGCQCHHGEKCAGSCGQERHGHDRDGRCRSHLCGKPWAGSVPRCRNQGAGECHLYLQPFLRVLAHDHRGRRRLEL